MTYLRWIAVTCFVVDFAATFTTFYKNYHYLWLSLFVVGMVCLVLSWRRERA
jgi:hypothetical protein